jgi:GNAT superfamily N-acetyltransferase
MTPPTTATLDRADWPLLKALRLAALSDSPTAFGSTLARESAWTDDEWRDRALLLTTPEQGVIFVSGTPDRPLGIASGRRDVEKADIAHLHSMWVAPAARGTGLGRALAGSVIDWARGLGFARLSLSVTLGNLPAERLYRSLGFRLPDPPEVFPHPSQPGLLMQDMILSLRGDTA